MYRNNIAPMEFNSTYEKIILISTYNKTKDHIKAENVKTATDMNEYNNIIKNMKYPLEIVGGQGQQVKPYFDIDKKLPINTKFDEMNELVKYCNLIEKAFKLQNSKDIYILKREPRIIKGEVKHSYHLIIDNIKITATNIKKIINDNSFPPEFDRSCYSINQGICCPYADTKINVDGKVPPFKPFDIFKGFIDDAVDITKYSISYIKDEFKDWDAIILPPKSIEPPKTDIDIADDDDADDADDFKGSPEFINLIGKYLDQLSTKRATDYDSWLEICMCIINMGKKNKWKPNTIFDMCNRFSKKCISYDEDKNTNIYYKLIGDDTREKRVGYTRLLKCLKEDAPEYYKRNIVGSYSDVKKEFEKTHCFINNPVCIFREPKLDGVYEVDTEQILKQGDAELLNKNLFYMKKVYDESKNKYIYKKDPFFKEWCTDPDRLTYESLKFAPAGLSDDESKIYKNLFNGFKADKRIPDNYDYTLIEPILNHIKVVICANDDTRYDYFMRWLANPISNPKNKSNVAIVLYSEAHGTGKNTLSNFLISEVYGKEYSNSINNIDKVVGRFNNALAKKMFIALEEVSGDIKRHMETMKNLITEPYQVIEKKNFDSIMCDNYINLMLLTNNNDILDIDNNDRRFVILECSDSMKGNIEYFNNLHECIKHPDTGAIFIHYLRNMIDTSWSTIEFQKYRPITEAYNKQKLMNTKNYIKVLSYIIDEDGILIGGVRQKWRTISGVRVLKLSQLKLYKEYKLICENCMHKPYVKDKFINNITKNNTGITIKYDTNSKCNVLVINKEQVLEWVKEYKNMNVIAGDEAGDYDDNYITDDE